MYLRWTLETIMNLTLNLIYVNLNVIEFNRVLNLLNEI